MQDMNCVNLVGRLVRDAELKYTAAGLAVAKFTIAVHRRVKQGDGEGYKEEPNYFDISLWGRLGESLHPYLQKGKQIAVTGELRQDRWEQDGKQRSQINVIADNIQFLGGRADGDSGSGSVPSKPSGGKAQGNTGGATNDSFSDDIPF